MRSAARELDRDRLPPGGGSAAAAHATAAKKKHCKAGYHLVTVKKHGKKTKVCKKKRYIQQQG